MRFLEVIAVIEMLIIRAVILILVVIALGSLVVKEWRDFWTLL